MKKCTEHVSVLLKESINYLHIKPNGTYIDATFGRGGHSREILKLLTSGRLIAFDKDKTAIEYAKNNFKFDNFDIFHTDFSDIKSIVEDLNLVGKIDGILLDLGVSSPQLDDNARGFSFRNDGPLDMRMNVESSLSAEKWINSASIEDMRYVFKVYGEERYANRVAVNIAKRRTISKFTRTLDLANVIADSIPNSKFEKKHKATRCFQAIRIHINNELDSLKTILSDSVDILSHNANLVVISFHSLEDRIVKNFMKEVTEKPSVPYDIPLIEKDLMQGVKFSSVAKKIKADKYELEKNSRARSAILRAIKRNNESYN